MRVLFVLQNAWRKRLKQKKWYGKGWERALWRSQTGKRLKEYIPKDCEFLVINSTPRAADNRRDVLPVDVEYVRSRIRAFDPDEIVLLGRAAQRLGPYLDDYEEGTMLNLPHPCYRALTKEATAQYRESIARASG